MRKYFILGSSLLLLAVAFFFTNNTTLMLRPQAWTAYFQNPKGTLLNLNDPMLWPRYLHFVLASLAVGGLFISVLSWIKDRKKAPRPKQEKMDLGLKIFAFCTCLQLFVGL